MSMASIGRDVRAQARAIAINNDTTVEDVQSLHDFYSHQHMRFLVLAGIALVTTLVFVGVLTMSLQRRLVLQLVTMFNFAFPSSQLLAASVALMQATRWEVCSCMAIASWCIWFHLCLCLDALTPAIKRCFHWRKRFAAVIVVFSLLSICHVVAEILAPQDVFADFVVQLPSVGMSISMRTFLFNRLVTIVMWNSRLAWRCAFQLEEELMLVRGTVEYRSPFEMFPIANPSATVPS